MEQVTTPLTKEQQEAILQSFRNLIKERFDLRRLLNWTPTDAQRTEMLRNAPTSLDALTIARAPVAQFGDPEDLTGPRSGDSHSR